MGTQKRIVAVDWASEITSNSTVRDFEKAGHMITSLNLKQLAITPKGAAKTYEAIPFSDKLMRSSTESVTIQKRAPGTETANFSVIQPGMSPHVLDPLEGLWEMIKMALKREFDYSLTAPLTIQSMITYNYRTETRCTWKAQRLNNYDKNVSRLILETVNKMKAEDAEYADLINIAAGLRYKDCDMVGKVHYSCSLA